MESERKSQGHTWDKTLVNAASLLSVTSESDQREFGLNHTRLDFAHSDVWVFEYFLEQSGRECS